MGEGATLDGQRIAAAAKSPSGERGNRRNQGRTAQADGTSSRSPTANPAGVGGTSRGGLSIASDTASSERPDPKRPQAVV